MVRRLLFAGALLASGAACAQDVAISGKDFLSGAGDAKIAELARQAAASGKTLIISAPPYWQDKAAAKAHAGAANASVRMSDAFFENVMVRVEDSRTAPKVADAPPPAPKPKAEPKPEPRPEPKVAAAPPPRPAPVETPAPAPAPKPAVVEAPPPAPTPVETAPSPAATPVPVAAPPVPAPVAAAPAPAPAPAAAAKAAPAPDPAAASRQRLAQNLNGGQPAEGTLQVAQLQKDDLLFVDGPTRAVVRRFGPRTQMYWLDGDLNLERSELVPTGPGRYRINEPVRKVANPSLRGSGKAASSKFVSAVPAPKSPARVAIERQYNDGRDIERTVTPADLRQGDLVYTGDGSAVVVRRTSSGMDRLWLVGELDLHQSGLQTQGNAIRILTDTIK